MAKKEKVKILVGILIVIVLAFIISIISGCALNHKGETSIGIFKDIETHTEGTTTASITRPARD